MYFYLRRPLFAPLSGLFSAKFSAFWCKIACVLMLNALRFAAKCSAFWCKTQGKMVQNAVRFAAKCEAKSINIHSNCINKTFKIYEIHAQKGQNGHQKVGFGGLKMGFWAAKIMSWQAK